MVGLPFQYCHEHKQKLSQLSLRAVMKTASDKSPFGHSSNKNRLGATQYPLLSGFLNDDGHPIRKLQKLITRQRFNANNLNGIFLP